MKHGDGSLTSLTTERLLELAMEAFKRWPNGQVFIYGGAIYEDNIAKGFIDSERECVEYYQ